VGVDSTIPGAAAPAPPVVGMVGAGQLARMTAQAAIGLGIAFRVLADVADDSAAQVCASTEVGDYRSAADVVAFGARCDVVTFDHEHVPGAHLTALERVTEVRPGGEALRYAQDKGAMRARLSALGIGCPRYRPVASLDDVIAFAADVRAVSVQPAPGPAFSGPAFPGPAFPGPAVPGPAVPGPAFPGPAFPGPAASSTGWPVVLKATSGGYDGKGVWICADPDAAASVLAHGISLLAEEHVAFDRELAVLVARSPKGQGAVYPVVQTIQQDGICREVIAPAPDLDPDIAIEAQRLGLIIAAELGVTGLLAVELFQTGSVLTVNELAMRPHNCGHWTIDGARTSQFEQHLRAILDLPLGVPELVAASAVMVNVLGGDDPDLYSRLVHVMAADPGMKVHLYGKPVRPGRKVGHVTVAGRDVEKLRDRAWRAANYLSLGTEEP
jgi:5-(carboxyamino)imidazole ribonucleotide synthase